MSEFYVIHPDNPQERLIHKAALLVKQGGIIVYPTDSTYAIGCQLENKSALERIRQLRKLDPEHHFTLICRDLSEISTYALFDNATFKILKANTPGPFTFILKASVDVPKRLLHPKRKTIGLRIPDNRIDQALLTALNEPLMSVTLALPNDHPFTDATEIREKLANQVDLIIDGGPCEPTPTAIVDLVSGEVVMVRDGERRLVF